MSTFNHTAELLTDSCLSLNDHWQSVQDVWLDGSRTEFENSFWLGIDSAIKTTLDDFRRFTEIVQHAQNSL